MQNDDRALALLKKYGDGLYRFAYILTLSDGAAGQVLSDAFADVTGKLLLTESDKDDRKTLFKHIYKNAVKRRTGGVYDESKYGKKSETFNEIVKLPIKERAIRHLMLYEEMTEQEAKEVISGK